MPKTIQLQEETYEDLKAYKVGGLTFDDVVKQLMENFDVERFHKEYRAWQRRVVANMKKSGQFRKL
ncbi:MAG TPA: antitoxin VapB family protein [Thermoplasmata archaeon]|nr:antitoxin VapB family protein [Thermoplasmata archaeon]